MAKCSRAISKIIKQAAGVEISFPAVSAAVQVVTSKNPVDVTVTANRLYASLTSADNEPDTMDSILNNDNPNEGQIVVDEGKVERLAELGVTGPADMRAVITGEKFLKTPAEHIVETQNVGGKLKDATISANQKLSRIARRKAKAVKIDGQSRGVKSLKIDRIKSMEDITPDIANSWEKFLETYFLGAPGLGMEFKVWADDIIIKEIVSFDHRGMVENIHQMMENKKAEIEARSARNPFSTKDGNVIAAIKNSDASKMAYFEAILAEEFDFILPIVNGMVAVVTDGKEAEKMNFKVEGLEFQDEAIHKTRRINFSRIPDGPAKVAIMARIGKLNAKGSIVIDDDPETGVNVMVKLVSEKNAFHQDEFGNVYFTDETGISHDVTEKPYYKINAAADKINKDSMDPLIDALSQDTEFIKGVFKMFRLVGDDNVPGRRMDYYDYIKLTPLLVGHGNTQEKLIAKLKDIIAKKLPQAPIARGILTYVIGGNIETITPLSNAEGVHNDSIVTALMTALTNKDQIRYGHVVEGRTKITRKAADQGFSYLIEDEMVRALLDGSYTRAEIEQVVDVVSTTDASPHAVKLNLPGFNNPIAVDELNTREQINALAGAFGLEGLLAKLDAELMQELSDVTAVNAKISAIFQDIALTAAANIEDEDARYDTGKVSSKTGLTNFGVISPVIMLEKHSDVLITALGPDVTKGETIAGSKMPANKPTDRNATINQQIDKVDHHNKYVLSVPTSFNPFIRTGLNEDIPHAEYLGQVIKSPTTKDGEPIPLSSWGLSMRVEFSIVQGMLEFMDKTEVGSKVFLQPIAYSDKSQIPMHEVDLGFNAFAPDQGTHKKLKQAWVSYNLQKNIDLQRISIDKMWRAIGGNINLLSARVNVGENGEARVTALKEAVRLMDEMLTNPGDKVNLTHEINVQLAEAHLSMDDLTYSDTDLDKNVDYVNIGGDVVIKPHMGELADQFKNSPDVLEKGLMKGLNNDYNRMGLDMDSIQDSLDEAGITIGIDEFLERVAFINGVYGHGLKTLTMGDESYFDTRYKQKSYAQYRQETTADPGVALQDTVNMMVKQSKRAQSNLTNGSIYPHRLTLQGKKIDSAKDNLLHYAKIHNDSTFVFSGLENKSLEELYALGIISKTENGKLMYKNGTVLVNIGAYTYRMSVTDPGDAFRALTSQMDNSNLSKEVSKLIKEAVALSPNIEQDVDRDGSRFSEERIGLARTDRKKRLSINQMRAHVSVAHKNTRLKVGDYTPSLLLSDPVSTIDLMNAMGISQENSDAIQLMHPLYELMFTASRGGKLSGFYSEDSNALKTLTTTFEYGTYRQQLQKKSVQNHFSMEQMSKLGGPEVFNMLKKMNSAITFTTTKMALPVVDAKGMPILDENGKVANTVEMEINNVEDLFNYFKGYERGNDSAWTDVAATLQNYGENMHDFIGLLSVPSNQKTGHRRMNKWSEVTGKGKQKYNIDYMAQEFNVEVLTKKHGYDTSENADHKAKLTLLSQLVNAVGFGGLTNTPTRNLQNALESLSEVDSIMMGNTLADSIGDVDLAEGEGVKDKIIEQLRDGNMTSHGLNAEEKLVFDKALQAGLYDMVVLAFDSNMDSQIIKDILQNPEASVDSPLVRQKVMNMLRSGFYKDVIQSKMSGFIGTVSVTHNVINIHEVASTGKRLGRKGFVDHYLNNPSDGMLKTMVMDNFESDVHHIVPTDTIIVDGVRGLAAKYIKVSSLEDGLRDLVASGAKVEFVSVPLKVDKFEDLDSFDEERDSYKVMVNSPAVKGTHPKWFVEKKIEEYNSGQDEDNQIALDDLLADGSLKRYVQDDHSLRWYKITRGDEVIEETDAYKAAYEGTMAEVDELRNGAGDTAMYKKLTARKEELTAALILETQKVLPDGKKYWDIKAPEVVLPMFNKAAFDIGDGISLHEIIGTDGHDRINAIKFFVAQNDPRFKMEDMGERSRDVMIEKYNRRKLSRMKYADTAEIRMYNDILSRLNTSGTDRIPSADINDIIVEAKRSAAISKADSFIESLNVTMTRIPGQTKQSGFAATVVEFLDAQGNATFAPVEHLVNTGGDFDIDTLSVLTKTVAANGRIVSYKNFLFSDPSDGSVNSIVDNEGVLDTSAVKRGFKRRLAEVVTETHKAKDAYNNQLIARADKLKSEIMKKLIDVRDIKKGTNPDAAHIAGLETEIDNQKTELLSLRDLRITEEEAVGIIKKARKLVKDEFTAMLTNAMENGVRSSLVDVNTAVEVQTPISMDMFGGLQRMIDDVETPGELDKYKHKHYKIDGLAYTSHFIIEDLAAQGKEAIGIFATVLKMNSAAQSAFYTYEKMKEYDERSSKDKSQTNPFVWHFEAKYDSKFTGKAATITRTGYADIERYRIAAAIAEDPDLQSAVNSMINADGKASDASIEKFMEMVTDEVSETIRVLQDKKGSDKLDITQIILDKVQSLTGLDLNAEVNPAAAFGNTGAELLASFQLC